jgi:hypothetical protein
VVVANLTTIMETHATSLCRISTRLHGQQAPPAIEFYRISCKVASQALAATGKGNREILNSKVTRTILIVHRPKRTSMPRHKLNLERTNRLQVINLVLPGGKTRSKSIINHQRSRNIRVSV